MRPCASGCAAWHLAPPSPTRPCGCAASPAAAGARRLGLRCSLAVGSLPRTNHLQLARPGRLRLRDHLLHRTGGNLSSGSSDAGCCSPPGCCCSAGSSSSCAGSSCVSGEEVSCCQGCHLLASATRPAPPSRRCAKRRRRGGREAFSRCLLHHLDHLSFVLLEKRTKPVDDLGTQKVCARPDLAGVGAPPKRSLSQGLDDGSRWVRHDIWHWPALSGCLCLDLAENTNTNTNTQIGPGSSGRERLLRLLASASSIGVCTNSSGCCS